MDTITTITRQVAANAVRPRRRLARLAAGLALIAGVGLLGGCVTTDYGYRGAVSAGAGDYYYAQPSAYDDGWYDDGWYGNGWGSFGIGYGSGWDNGWYGGWGWPYAGAGYYGPGWWNSGWGWGWPGYYYPPVVIVRPRPLPPPNNHLPPPTGGYVGSPPLYGNHGELLNPPPGALPRPVQGLPAQNRIERMQRIEEQNMLGAGAEAEGLPRMNRPPRIMPVMPAPRVERVEREMGMAAPMPRVQRNERVERMPAMPRMEAPPAPRLRERDDDRNH